MIICRVDTSLTSVGATFCILKTFVAAEALKVKKAYSVNMAAKTIAIALRNHLERLRHLVLCLLYYVYV